MASPKRRFSFDDSAIRSYSVVSDWSNSTPAGCSARAWTRSPLATEVTVTAALLNSSSMYCRYRASSMQRMTLPLKAVIAKTPHQVLSHAAPVSYGGWHWQQRCVRTGGGAQAVGVQQRDEHVRVHGLRKELVDAEARGAVTLLVCRVTRN